MKTLYIVLTILLRFIVDISAAPWDTGYIEWEQPDATKFTARSWGDEFAGWMETDDGYQIILGPDEYYYYAVLDQNGEFTYSENKVGIDNALSESYHLERSPQRLAEIESEIEDCNEQLEQNYIDFMAEFDGPSAPPLRLAIVLIDFADSLSQEKNYNKEYWDTLFFSTNYYYTIDQQTGPKSPDLEWVYGSVRDYYRNQSINKFDIVGKIGSDRSIVNPPDPNNPNKPLWVYMPEDKSFYDSLDKYYVISLVKAEAENQLNVDLDQYNKTGFIYAGGAGSGGTRATGIQDIFTCYERYEGNSQVGTFAHIGIPAHEFAHTLGVGDEYGIPLNDLRNWSLMAMGIYNGGDIGIENDKGSCPAPFSPATRIKFNWVIPIDLNPQENFIVQYNYSAPYFYKINVPYSSEYFVIERRQKEGYDLYTPKYENPNDPPKGILIWHVDLSYTVQLEPANNIFPVGETGVRFPLNAIQDFTDLTAPSSNKRNGDYSFISLKNIEWIYNQQHAILDFNLEAIQISGNQTWSTDTNLSLPLFIKNGGILSITNGADVIITGAYLEQIKFVIESGGSLNITGAEENKSIIQSTQPNQEWKGIEIFDTGIINCSHIIIQDAMNPIKVISPTHFVSCTLNNSEIIGNTITLNGNMIIENSIFSESSLHIYTADDGSKLKHNIFSSQSFSQFVKLANPISSYLEVANCTFNGLDYGLVFSVPGEQFGDRTNQITVRNNIFSNCGNSIKIHGGSISISYNDFFNNHYDENKGGNYLEEDPLCVDPDNNNFNLLWGSPCIDAGHPSSVYNDPDGTRNDIGAKYYHQSIITTSVIGGWQTLSVPVVVNDFTKTVVWPTANSNAYSFCGSGYINQTILQNGIGYYISFPSTQDISYIGRKVEEFSVPVCAEWNIIGSITEEVPISTNVCLFPSENSFTSLVYIYQNGYQLVNNIIPGMGHWVKVAMAGSINVYSEPSECKSQDVISEEGLDHFIITDAQGKKQDLYVANQSLNPSLGEIDLSMPPIIPEIGFDARFEAGEYIKLVSPDSGMIEIVINIETQSYPVNVSWELNPENGITYSFIPGIGKQSNVHSGSATITSSVNGNFIMSANASDNTYKADVPEEYMLSQNYPNPFNPSTTVVFDLPEKSFVSLKMFSITGEEVRKIVNEQMDAGRYHFLIDGNGLSSGVYLLRMISDDFVSTKKIIMMK